MNNKRKKEDSMPAEVPNPEGMRLNKFIAHAGICSRRQAAEYVKKGYVKVNNEVCENPGYQVQKGDEIRYRGKVVQLEEKLVYILLNKPKGFITTLSDDRGRRTVMDILGNNFNERIYPVGRLDRATTGLLLLTNDGSLAQKLAHPRYSVQKFYHVVLNKPVLKEHIQQIAAGFDLEDGPVQVDDVNYVKGKGKEEVGVGLHIGRNRIVRRIFEHFGYEVVKLDRTYYAGLNKKNLPKGKFRHLTERELIMLKHIS